ncbi:hypothetical protein ACLOJK_036974 [Asimina triloba]
MGENNSNSNIDVKVQDAHGNSGSGAGDHVHMLAAAAAMSLPGPVDDQAGTSEGIQVAGLGLQPVPVHYLHEGEGGEGEQEGSVGEGMDTEASTEHQQQLVTRSQTASQLTLSFQGEVYVFDSVSADKVQAVLLLLGGREVSAPVVTVTHQNKLSNVPQSLNMSQRAASLMRFREKRKERNYGRKVRYTVRKEVALRMHRYKGQFASKTTVEEAERAQSAQAAQATSSGSSWGSTPRAETPRKAPA